MNFVILQTISSPEKLMICLFKTATNITSLPVVLFILLFNILLSQGATAQTEAKPFIGIRMPESYDPRVNIVEEQRYLGLHMNGFRTPLLKNRLSILKRNVEIDSTGENINFTEKIGDLDYRLANYLPLEDYITTRRNYKMRDSWIQTTVSKLEETTQGKRGSGGFRIDIPVEIKSKAFQKIFGGIK